MKSKIIRPKSSQIREQALNKTQQIIKQTSKIPSSHYQQITNSDIIHSHSQSVSTNTSSYMMTAGHIHNTPPKQYRIPQQDVYNHVRNSICETFKQKTSRNYDLVKELTEIAMPDSAKQKVIDRLCKKYSILRENKRKKGAFQNVDIDVELIASRYVKSKSIQKQKQDIKEKLKIDIAKNYRYGRDKEYQKSQQFFSLDGKALIILQKKYQQIQRNKKDTNDDKSVTSRNASRTRKQHKRSKSQNKIHPYIQLYEKAQQEALENITNKNKLSLQLDFPIIPQPQAWQKNSHQLKRVLNKRQQNHRQIQSARTRSSMRMYGVGRKPDFYLS